MAQNEADSGFIGVDLADKSINLAGNDPVSSGVYEEADNSGANEAQSEVQELLPQESNRYAMLGLCYMLVKVVMPLGNIFNFKFYCVQRAP